MKHLNKFLIILLGLLLFSACKKNVVEYQATPVDDGVTAQFQLHYMVPVTTGAANNINRIELNGKLLTNQTTPLVVYNFLPSASVGRFFAAESGKVNLKLYKGAADNLVLVYDQTFDLPAGKSNVVVHDFNKPPVIITNEVPYPKTITENTGTTAWIKFYNFLYESANIPTSLKLQYQYQYTVNNETGQKSEWTNVGKPVSFGEATGWEPVTVNKTVIISAGTARIDYRARLIGVDGSDQGSLVVRNSTGSMVDYTDWWTAQIGRVYHHMLAGFRTATPIAGVKQATAL